MEGAPIITVGIPVYNEELYLVSSIDSVLNQSLKNFELIISDNCSTDASYEIAKTYALKDTRVKAYRHEQNMGIPFNFKFPLLKASTKYFVWLGAHDLFTPEYLKTTIDYLEKNDSVSMVYSNADWIDSQGNFMYKLEEDIQTVGLSRRNALLKIINNTDSGIAVHSVFRTSILQQISYSMEEGDMLLCFIMATYGDIAKLNITGLLFRLIRTETVKERLKRYEEIKIIKSSILNLTLITIKKYLDYIVKNNGLNIREKLLVSISVIRKFTINLTWLAYKRYINKSNIRTAKQSHN